MNFSVVDKVLKQLSDLKLSLGVQTILRDERNIFWMEGKDNMLLCWLNKPTTKQIKSEDGQFKLQLHKNIDHFDDFIIATGNNVHGELCSFIFVSDNNVS